MKITVIVSTFRRARLLVQSLAAVLRNDYEDFELILVDQTLDGSTKRAVGGLFLTNHACSMSIAKE